MLELLFGNTSGLAGTAATFLSIAGTLCLCAALFLLGRRNEVGWWLVAGSYGLWALSSLLMFSPSRAASPLGLLLFVVGIAVPLILGVGIGIYGLLLFQKFAKDAPLTRAITVRSFSGMDVLIPLAVALVFGIASLIPVLSIFASFGRFQQLPTAALLSILGTGILAGLLPAGLVGLAHRCRWAWFLLILPSLLEIYSIVRMAGGSVKIILSLSVIALAVYGWKRWGSLRVAPALVKQTIS